MAHELNHSLACGLVQGFSSTGTEKVGYLVIYTSTNASDQVFDHQVKGFWHLKLLLHQSKLSLAQLPCNKSQSESNSSSRAVNYKPKWLYKQRSSDQISTSVLTPLQKETLWSNPSHRISRRMETWSSRWGNKEFPKGEIYWSDPESLGQLLLARNCLLCVWAMRLCLLPLADGIGVLHHELIHPGQRFWE